jgi:NitT/TauT family transport system ATP-binding protein
VEKTYGGPSGLKAIATLDLTLDADRAVSIVGPSGCGKSTLMRIVAGLDEPTGGAIMYGSTPVRGPIAGTSVVFQRDLLLEWRSVLKNVLLPAEIMGLTGRRSRALELLDEFGLGDFADAYPWQLSGGMRQRVALARALLSAPAVLFMDEPFSALDALTRDQMNVLLRRIQASEKVMTVLITHSISEAIFCADRVLVMSGRPGSILDDIAVPFGPDRKLAVRETPEFTGLVRRVREQFERTGVLVG